ncbi:hypothetical protein BWP39_08790 [Paraburkholderia acidicola]|uniref:DUF2968 family protein n=1 Tax=Paraburkholderia acidicola TaxID=1912599 RepID=A0A2A4EZ30_9BURK|nr:DUF2968 domain-containing protein [Paraburkholderia acidicola]PCE26873.1 hypothetical protein BWP39_08790 [Paraburkholderia acidicola]
MDHKSTLRHLALAAFVALAGVQSIAAQTLPDGATSAAAAVVSQPSVNTALPSTTPLQSSAATAQSSSPSLTPAEAQESAAGNVAELQQMIRGSDLSELRTTYNGTYGASLLFYGKEMTYYVALFQQKNFWRVIKTSDETRAEMIYKDFSRQTLQLSDVEIRRTRLEAQKSFTERMIALSQDRASRLQSDLNVARQQQSIVSDQQRANQAQAIALSQQRASAQEQLRAAQRQVRELQRQLENGLPTN